MLGILTKLLYLLALTPFEAQAFTSSTHRVKSERKKDSRKSIDKSHASLIESSLSAISSNSTHHHNNTSTSTSSRNKTSSSRLTKQKDRRQKDETFTFQLPPFNFKTSESIHNLKSNVTSTLGRVPGSKSRLRIIVEKRNETIHQNQHQSVKGKKKEKRIETKIHPLPKTALSIHHSKKKPEKKQDNLDDTFSLLQDTSSFYNQFRFFNLGCSAVMSVLAYFFSLDVELLREQADERDDDDDSLIQNRLWFAKKVEYFHWLSAYFYFSGFLFAKQDDPESATIWQVLGLTSQFGGLIFAGAGIFDIVQKLELNGDKFTLV